MVGHGFRLTDWTAHPRTICNFSGLKQYMRLIDQIYSDLTIVINDPILYYSRADSV